MDSLISVIVPVYNVADYLALCVRSICAQTYTNLEIILVDDGSTDGSEGLCDVLGREDERISVYHKENGGLSDARNYGLELAHGDFLAFIDSDDALHPDFFAALMHAQRKINADIVTCELSLFFEEDELQQLSGLNCEWGVVGLSREEALKAYLYSPIISCAIYHGLCMKIYRRTLFEGLRFEKGRLHEDLFITYRLFDLASQTAYVDCPYYFYNQSNSNSIMKNYGIKNFIDKYDAYNRIHSYFRNVDELENDLTHFLIVEYFEMLVEGFEMRNEPEIHGRYSDIKHWLLANLRFCSYYSIPKKAILHASLLDIRVYMLSLKLRSWLKK